MQGQGRQRAEHVLTAVGRKGGKLDAETVADTRVFMAPGPISSARREGAPET